MVKVVEEESEFMFEEPVLTKTAAKTNQAPDDSRAGQLMDVISYYNIGRLLVRIIPEDKLTDGKRRTQRIVRFGVAGRVIDPSSDKGYKINVQIPAPEDFKCKLNQGQYNRIQKLREQARKFSDFTSFNNKGKYPQIAKLVDVKMVPQQVFTFAKLLDQKADNDEVNPATLGHVRLLKFAKGTVGQTDYATLLKKAVDKES